MVKKLKKRGPAVTFGKVETKGAPIVFELTWRWRDRVRIFLTGGTAHHVELAVRGVDVEVQPGQVHSVTARVGLRHAAPLVLALGALAAGLVWLGHALGGS